MTIKKSLLLVLLISLAVSLPAQEKGTLTDARDGKTYTTVKIGTQTWMGQNLAWLPAVFPVYDSQFDLPCYYVYGYNGRDISLAKNSPMYGRYGVLYNFTAALDACPSGWHLPSDEEWSTLEEYLGLSKEEAGGRDWRSSGQIAPKIKSTTGWKEGTSTNETGLTLMPGGCRGYEGYQSETYCGYYWTSTPVGIDNGLRRGVCGDDNGVSRQDERRYFGCSVRCIKDK